MQQQTSQLQSKPCPRCHKLIQLSRYPIHIFMCSTINLRQSCIIQSRNSKQIQNYNYTECIFCMENIQVQQIEKHMSQCNEKFIRCDKCKFMYPLNTILEHRQLCGGFLVGNLENNGKQGNLATDQDHTQHNVNIQHNAPKQAILNLLSSLTSLGQKLKDEGLKLLRYIQNHKQSAMETLNQIRNDFYQSLQIFFIRAAQGPGVEGLSKRQIRKITCSVYCTKNNGQQEDMCAICYCQFQHEQPIKILQCKHIYHPECIDKWMRINRKCPLCNHLQFGNN